MSHEIVKLASLVLLILLIGFAGGAAWLTADKASLANKETLEIIVYPDVRLRSLAKPVQNVEFEQARIGELVEAMRNTLVQTQADSLSAPQARVLERVIVVRTSTGVTPARSRFLAMVNPVIISRDGTSTGLESCLSLPDDRQHLKIERSAVITVRYLTVDGRDETLTANEETARYIQHEIDHLDGKEFTDYARQSRWNGRSVAAVAIYALAAAVSAAWYVRNRLPRREKPR